jgi:hypothetical protein
MNDHELQGERQHDTKKVTERQNFDQAGRLGFLGCHTGLPHPGFSEEGSVPQETKGHGCKGCKQDEGEVDVHAMVF